MTSTGNRTRVARMVVQWFIRYATAANNRNANNSKGSAPNFACNINLFMSGDNKKVTHT